MKILTAEHIEKCRLLVVFENNEEREIDVAPLLKHSNSPLFWELLNEEKFIDFTISKGELIWPKYNILITGYQLCKISDCKDTCDTRQEMLNDWILRRQSEK